MNLTCGGRRADRLGRLVGAACGQTWASAPGVDPFQSARAALWRVGPVDAAGNRPAMCPRCARRVDDDSDDVEPPPPVTGGEQLSLIPGPTPAPDHAA